MKKNWIIIAVFAFVAYQLFFAGGGWFGSDSPSSYGNTPNGDPTTADLVIVSGSENKGLQPIINRWADREGVEIAVVYKGSVDIYRSLQQGAQAPYDAVWPANHLWIELGDTQKVVKHEQSIMRSPVVLGLKKSIAQQLGWDKNPVTTQDILAATEQGKFRLAMTSATQSNSGSSAYMAFLYAMSDYPDTLTLENLADENVQAQVKRMLSTVNRSSGSSGWLKEAYVEHPDRFDAMFNYEAMLIEANQAMTRRGAQGSGEPLCAIYPDDGLMVADSPLGYINKGDDRKETLFQKLQAHLLSEDVQQQIEGMGRRTGLLGMSVSNTDTAIWNPDWCIDTQKTIASIPVPSQPVIQEALSLYQTELRKPSLTVWVLDVSGSMQGDGINGLRRAMTTLLDTNLAKEHLLQAGKNDITYVIPFNHDVQAVWKIEGNNVTQMNDALRNVQLLDADGGTDLYRALVQAMQELQPYYDDNTLWNYLPAIVAMTDGRSRDENQPYYVDMLQRLPYARDIPIHAIAFGDADKAQMQALTAESVGRLFTVKHDLPGVLRKAKGYN